MKQFHDCSINITEEDIEILPSTSRSARYLMTMEASWVIIMNKYEGGVQE